MIKTYRRTDTIKAEQFDGSDAMVKKYHVGYDEAYILPFRIETLVEGWIGMKVGDWIATGVGGENWPIADDVFKKTYAELPVIPVEIANAIEEYRDRFGSAKGLNELITDMNVPWKLGVLETVTAIPEVILGVFRSKTDVLARAWLDGYQIDNKS